MTTESIFSEPTPQIKALVRNLSAFTTLFAPGKSWDNVRSTAAPYTESRLTRSVANERVGFQVVEQTPNPKCHLYWLKWHSLRSLPFWGPKKSQFQGPPLQTHLVMDFYQCTCCLTIKTPNPKCRLYWPKWHSLRSLPFRGPKKSRFQGPPLQTPLVMEFSPIQIHMSRPTLIVKTPVKTTFRVWCLYS